MKAFFLVQTPEGNIVNESLAFSQRSAENNFVKSWSIERIRDHMSNHCCWEVWHAYKAAGFVVVKIELEDWQIEKLNDQP